MKYPHALYTETVQYFSLIIIATEHFDIVSQRGKMVTSSMASEMADPVSVLKDLHLTGFLFIFELSRSILHCYISR